MFQDFDGVRLKYHNSKILQKFTFNKKKLRKISKPVSAY